MLNLGSRSISAGIKRRAMAKKPSVLRSFSAFSGVDPFKRTDSFARRHMGPKGEETAEMLKLVGFDSMDVRIYPSYSQIRAYTVE